MRNYAYIEKPVKPLILLSMKTDCPLPDAALDMVAHRFAILAEPMRLRILKALFDGEKNVSGIVASIDGSQSNVSRHLQSLTGAGILGRRKDGLEVYYFITDRSIYSLCELVCGSLEKQLAKQAKAFSHA
jgi:ArsR family transcriptional regulator